MSFPYTTTSPPPTAGSLPIIERANLSAAPYGGGGGGGGASTVSTFATASISSLAVSSINGASPGGGGSVGPDPVFSTVTAVYANLSTGITINGDGGSPKDGGVIWPAQGVNSNAVGIGLNGITGGGQYGNNLVLMAFTSDFDGAGNAGPGEMAVQRMYYVNSAGPGNSTYVEWNQGLHLKSSGPIWVDGLLSASTMNVSTINGAPYTGGGGGPPPAVVSTISSIVNLSTINVGSPGIVTVAGSMLVTDYLGASQVSTASIVSIVPGGAVAVPSLNTSSITSGASQINMTVPVGVSSLTVSSINGASYPPASGSASFSSIGIPGGAGASTFVCDPMTTSQVIQFSTITGHTYTAYVGARALCSEAPTDTQAMLTEIYDNLTGYTFGSWPLSQVSTLTSGGFFQQVGGSLTWKAADTGAAFSVYGNLSTSVRVDTLNLVDYGAI